MGGGLSAFEVFFKVQFGEPPCRDAFAGFHEIGDAFESVVILLFGGFEFGVQWSVIRPRTAETFEELFAEGIRWG